MLHIHVHVHRCGATYMYYNAMTAITKTLCFNKDWHSWNASWIEEGKLQPEMRHVLHQYIPWQLHILNNFQLPHVHVCMIAVHTIIRFLCKTDVCKTWPYSPPLPPPSSCPTTNSELACLFQPCQWLEYLGNFKGYAHQQCNEIVLWNAVQSTCACACMYMHIWEKYSLPCQ